MPTLPIFARSRVGPAARASIALAVAVIVAACAADSPTEPGAAALQVTVSPRATSVLVGQSYTYTAQIIDADGHVAQATSVTWRSSANSIATIDASTGVATGQAAGQAMIVALIDGVPRDSAILSVHAPTPNPTPNPTPDPTPDPSPNPTPDPTPNPTPGPTPNPTPDPTPTPTPTPTPGDNRCGGVMQTVRFSGTVNFRYSHGTSQHGVTFNFDDIGDMNFSVPRTSVGTDGATWSGVVDGGSIRVNESQTSSQGQKTTLTGGGAPELMIDGHPASTVTVRVDLRSCTYSLAFTAVTTATGKGYAGDAVSGPAQIATFSSPRIPLSSNSFDSTVPVHSALWVMMSNSTSGYFVSGDFAAQMFAMGGNDVAGEGGASVGFTLGRN